MHPGMRPGFPPGHPNTYRPPGMPPGMYRGGPPSGPVRPPAPGVKRPPPQGILNDSQKIKPVKQKKPGDRLLPPSVRDLVPESQAYSDLLHLERKVSLQKRYLYNYIDQNYTWSIIGILQVDYTIMRKRLEMQESLKRPQKIKKKLRLFITNSYYPANPQQSNSTGNWELRVEGRLLEQESLNR